MITKRELYNKVGEELNIPPEVVALAHKSMINFIKDTISSLDLSTITEEEFIKIRTSFNIPALGKLYTNINRIEGAKKRIEYLKKLKELKNGKNT